MGTGLFEASRNSPQCGEGGTVNIGALIFKYVADVPLGLLAALMSAWFAATLTRPRRKVGGLDPRRGQLGLQVRRDDLTAPAGAARARRRGGRRAFFAFLELTSRHPSKGSLVGEMSRTVA